MRSVGLWVLAPLLAVLPLAACVKSAADTVQHAKAGTVEAVEGSELSRVLLSARAAERLGIETAAVRDTQLTPVTASTSSDGRTRRQVIPYAAVLYDPNGKTWTYTSPDSLVFVRHPISIEYIEGDVAVVSNGLPSGMLVVTVGPAELYGTEFGVGH